MSEKQMVSERKQGYCALCVSRCGCIGVIEDGHLIALEPDLTHPTGRALCAKGRAAPELVYHPDRLLYPLKRTRPKGDPDPGWQRITWEEAMSTVAAKLQQIAVEHGPESVVFSVSSPSTSASDDTAAWIARLMNLFGSPNLCASMELCGWGRYQATNYTFGAPVPGAYMPDLEQAGCILYWGYNPNLARLVHATATNDALKRGARLIVVDPRLTGVAKKADVWLQVRPGTDAALALGIADAMIEQGWYDRDFILNWTNGPLLVRTDTGRLLTRADLEAENGPLEYAAWSETGGRLVWYDPGLGRYEGDVSGLALSGAFCVQTAHGEVVCKPAFALAAENCQMYSPDRVAQVCGVAPELVERAAQMIWEARPLAYYAWSGVEMQTNSTQIARAIAQLSVLTGSFDAPGGNVAFSAVPGANVSGAELMPPGQRSKTLGLQDRPLGPARWGHVTSEELYRGILEQQPYGVHGLVGFGANLLLAHADTLRGREALANLDFYVHIDLFMNPTAEMADIVLPAASAFEREALKIGFELNQNSMGHVQLRQTMAPARGECRSDMQFVFDLACRLGYGEQFWHGSIEAAFSYQLEPSGITLDALRAQPGGVQAALQTRYRKYAEMEKGVPHGFRTPSRKIELYSETMLLYGYPPLPEFEEPQVSPRSRPDLAERFPLILTCVKNNLFCETQMRALPALRRQALDPEIELSPAAAAARAIRAGDWVRVETPDGSVRARAKLNPALQPDVVYGQHGWWQASPEIGAPGYDPFSADGANYNLLISSKAIDPVSGSVPQRAYMCQVRLE